MVTSYKGLTVWQKSMRLCKSVYVCTEAFPKSQQFSLVSQMQRAAISIPSNIAEGYNRQYTKEYWQFLSIAYGSAGELETQILLAADLGFIAEPQMQLLLNDLSEIAKMLHVMIHKMKDAI